MDGNSSGELAKHTNSGSTGIPDPINQKCSRLFLIFLRMKLPQFFFHVVGGGQRFVDFKGFFQALRLSPVFIEVVRIFEQQPSSAFQKALFKGIVKFMIQLSSQIRELFIEQLDDVEAVEDERCLGQIVRDGPDIGWRHIDSHSLDIGLGSFQPSPERLERIRPFAVADKHYSACAQIQYDGQIPMAFACRDFVNSDLAQSLELGAGKSAAKVSFLNVLDDIPAHSQMRGDILDGHTPTQVQDISLELPSIASALISEAQFDLTQAVTYPTKHSLNGQYDFHRFGTDGYAIEPAVHGSFADDLSGTARRACKVLFSFDDTKCHFAALIAAIDVLVATDTESVIQETGGYEGFLSSLVFGDNNEESPIVHIFSTPQVRKSRKNLNSECCVNL